VLRNGAWTAPGGLDRAVLALTRVRSCLYLGGAFTHTLPAGALDGAPGGASAPYAARLCDGASALEPLESFDGIGPVRACASAEAALE
jgi:hypothetical protein